MIQSARFFYYLVSWHTAKDKYSKILSRRIIFRPCHYNFSSAWGGCYHSCNDLQMTCHQFSRIVILNVQCLPNSKCECFMCVCVHTLSQLQCDNRLLGFHTMLLLLWILLERSHRENYIFNDSSNPHNTISASLNLNNFVFQTELYCTQYIYTLSVVTTQRWDPQLAIRVIYS